MKVILLRDVAKMGRKYEIISVSDGHAINFLLPRKLAIAATPEAEKRFQKERSAMANDAAAEQAAIAENLKKIDGARVAIEASANEQGHLFKKIKAEEVAEAIKSQLHMELAVELLEVEEPFKAVGEYTIEAKSGEAATSFTLEIKAKE